MPSTVNPGVTVKLKIKLLIREVLFIPVDIATNVCVYLVSESGKLMGRLWGGLLLRIHASRHGAQV